MYSEKGSRNINGRKPRKRGGKSKFRGISHEQVCVLVTRDRTKNTFVGLLGRGRIQKAKLDKAIGHNYSHLQRFVPMLGEHLKRMLKLVVLLIIPSKQTKNEQRGYSIVQNVNNYHQRLKQWIMRFHGVATKYL